VTENPGFQVNLEIPPEVSTTSSNEVAIKESEEILYGVGTRWAQGRKIHVRNKSEKEKIH